MMCRLNTFCFDRVALNLDARADLIGEIPAGERDRQRLFITLQQQLRFPYYFGHNWMRCLSAFETLTG
jgi:hypothetical protein